MNDEQARQMTLALQQIRDELRALNKHLAGNAGAVPAPSHSGEVRTVSRGRARI